MDLCRKSTHKYYLQCVQNIKTIHIYNPKIVQQKDIRNIEKKATN